MNAGQDLWGNVALLVNVAALLLALGFRRNRAALLLSVLAACALALSGVWSVLPMPRGLDAARMFAPWFLLITVAIPERRLLARSNLMVLGCLVFVAWLTVSAPEHVWTGLRQAFPLGVLDQAPGKLAAILVALAAMGCLLRGISSRLLLDGLLGAALVLVGIALLPGIQGSARQVFLALAGALALVGILHASYRMAFVDGLAGLPNRRSLDETLARISGDYAIAMVDVDHFKQFNDRHGHNAGDRALKHVATHLRDVRGAQAFRYGGEEFCLLFSGGEASRARGACEELREAIAADRIRVRDHAQSRKTESRPKAAQGVKLTVSIGLASRGTERRVPEAVLKAADKALYKAKADGRNRVVVL